MIQEQKTCLMYRLWEKEPLPCWGWFCPKCLLIRSLWFHPHHTSVASKAKTSWAPSCAASIANNPLPAPKSKTLQPKHLRLGKHHPTPDSKKVFKGLESKAWRSFQLVKLLNLTRILPVNLINPALISMEGTIAWVGQLPKHSCRNDSDHSHSLALQASSNWILLNLQFGVANTSVIIYMLFFGYLYAHKVQFCEFHLVRLGISMT